MLNSIPYNGLNFILLLILNGCLLADDKYKKIVISILRFLVQDKRIILNAPLIMHNIPKAIGHLVWQPHHNNEPSKG
jgi:hypothetical protein